MNDPRRHRGEAGAPSSLLAANGRLRLGPTVPAGVLRVVWALVAAGTAALQFQHSAWLFVALALVIVGAWRPKTLTPWFFLGLLGIGMLWHTPGGHDPALYAILAGAHLTHVIASFFVELSPGVAVQVRALVRPAVRYLVIQAGVQAVALVTFLVVPATGFAEVGISGAGLVGALALVALSGLIVLPIARAHRHPK